MLTPRPVQHLGGRVELAAAPRSPMDPLNLSWYDGDRNWSRALNASEAAQKPHYNYYAVLLTLLIFIIVFGNVLVCMAVSRERALQTTTNYLIVSLAVADLLVATLCMPWVVYLEVRSASSGNGEGLAAWKSAPGFPHEVVFVP